MDLVNINLKITSTRWLSSLIDFQSWEGDVVAQFNWLGVVELQAIVEPDTA